MSNAKSDSLIETIKTIVYAGLIALFVRTVAYEPFNIPSSSMVPTLLVGDYLFVSKYSYGYSRYSLPFGLSLFSGRILYHEPQRGDVVVFKLPRDTSVDYIKRLIGLPGDRIQVKDGLLYVNGDQVPRQQTDDYVEHAPNGATIRTPQYVENLPGGKTHPLIKIMGDRGWINNTAEYVVPPGHFFMMGDNRDNSQDSRFTGEVGFVPAENLVGRAEFVFFSHDGSASLFEVWKWPFAIRYSRMFQGIE